MRKLIVSTFVTLDGLYEGKDKSINSQYDYFHEDYTHDVFSVDRRRGHTSFRRSPAGGA